MGYVLADYLETIDLMPLISLHPPSSKKQSRERPYQKKTPGYRCPTPSPLSQDLAVLAFYHSADLCLSSPGPPEITASPLSCAPQH